MTEENKDLSKLTRDILSDIIVHMKYAKYIPELKRRENWYELVYRNRQMHIDKFPELEEEIREAYQYVFDKKVLPSLRSMQFAGKPIQLNNARLFNCSYAPIDDWRVFSEIMFLCLSGVGYGSSVQYHHIEKLPEIIKPNKRTRRFLISDSIEGWADAIKVLSKSYFFGGPRIIFDYGDIRQKGERLVTSGGKAPGPAPLRDCLTKIESIFDSKSNGDKLSTLEAHDIVCHIADAVLAGGIRRCLQEDSEVFTSEGWKKIKDCKVGDKAVLENKEYEIKNVFEQGTQDLIKVNTKNGFHLCTPNHRWYVWNLKEKKAEWVEAQNLCLGSYAFLNKKE